MTTIDPFALFCAYHLGLDERGRPRHHNIHDVARRFGTDTATVERALEAAGLSPARMIELDFDLAGARLDITASPAGVDLLSIAQMHWELLQQARDKPRDWEQEAADDAAENARVFGPSGPPRDRSDQ